MNEQIRFVTTTGTDRHISTVRMQRCTGFEITDGAPRVTWEDVGDVPFHWTDAGTISINHADVVALHPKEEQEQ